MYDPSRYVRVMLKSKIHRARVTEANVDYEGSVTIDRTLMDAADILEFEQVHVWNVTRGTRVTTYAIEGKRDSGVICINGAAAHLIGPNDVVIIATFTELPADAARTHTPTVVHVDSANKIKPTID